MATRRRALGFEAGTIAAYSGDITLTGTDVSVASGAARSGAYGLDCNLQSGVKSCINFSWGPPASWVQEFHRFYYKVPSAFPGTARIIGLFCAAGTTVGAGTLELYQRPDGKLEFKRNGSSLAISSSALSVGTTYRVEVGIESSKPSCSLRIDGNEEIAWTTSASLGQSGNVAFGGLDTVAAAFRFYLDDYTSDIQRWPGAGRVKKFTATGLKEDNATWTLGAGASKTAAINETTPDDDTSYILSSTIANSIYFAFDNVAADVNAVNGISWYVRHKRDGASNGSIAVRPRVGDSIIGNSVSTVTTTATAATFHSSATAPYSARGPAFRNEYFADHACGVHTLSGNGSRVSTIWGEYDYKDAADARMDSCPVLICDFEDATAEFLGNSSGAISGTVARDTAHPKFGAAALKITSAAAGRSYANLGVYTSFASFDTDAFLCGWFYVETLPTSGSYMDICGVAGTSVGRTIALEVNGDGSMRVTINGSTFTVAAAGTIVTGRYYFICLRVLNSTASAATDGRVAVYLDDLLIYNNTAVDTGFRTFGAQIWFIGSHQNVTGGAIIHVDGVFLDYSVRHTRSARVATISPTGAGTLTVAGFTASAGNKWDCLDEIPNNGDTDYVITSGTSAQRESYDTGNISSSAVTVYGVLVSMTAKRDGGTNGSIKNGVSSASDTTFISTGTMATTSAYTSFAEMFRAMIGRGEWTLALVQALELLIQENTATNKSRVTSIAATVAFTEITTRGQNRGGAVVAIG